MIHRKSLIVGLSIAALFAVAHADAYELATHARMTQAAASRSVLSDAQFYKSLGIDSIVLNPAGGFATNPFGDSYYDVSGNTVNARQADPNGVQFDVRFLGLPDGLELTLPAWLMRGAIREDDYPFGPNPMDDPVNAFRPRNHFYDPAQNRALTTILGLSLGEKAPDWGLGTSDVFGNPSGENTFRNNHYSVYDAREALYRALTGKKKDGSDAGPDNQPATKQDRDKYWATLFRALGDIVHLVEDMAQPQHTRNDPHAGKKFDSNFAPLGHKSVYEAYVEARATGGTFEVPGVFSMAANGLTYDGYAAPRFTDYLSYFTTRHQHPNPDKILARQGLADYSNRGFFSAGTNIESENNVYTLPDRNPAAYTPTDLYVDWQGEPLGSDPNAKVTILQGSVPDSLPGGQTVTNIPLTTYGAWDKFLRPVGKTDYSLNRYNYDAQADLLIPRAVAYSAGLIDYFFRGRIEAEDAHYTDTGIELKIRNALDPEKNPEWQNEILYAKTGSGNSSTLTITYEYKDEQNIAHYVTSNPVELVTDPNNSANDDNVAPGEVSKKVYSFTIDVPFVDPNDPRQFKDLKYRLVFHGKLGQEDDAVAAAAFRPTSGFLVMPSYVPSDGIGGARMIYRTSTGWKLAPDSGLVAGNIDWKGRYEADPADPAGSPKPTKVLSWVGPKMRYFPDDETCQSTPFYRCKWISSSIFSNEIFENGDVIANAPANVLGAAITKDLNRKDWLVAICMEGGTEEVVYRRPYRQGSDAPYDPVNAPNGWKEIGRFDAGTLNQGASRTTHHADIPWFFSGDGRKAQTLRRWWETTSNDIYERLMRLEVNITDDITLVMPPRNHDNLTGFEETHTCSTNYDQYGAGTGQSTYNASGEYIVAVDYDKDGNEILAKIRVTGNSTKTSTVSVAHNHQPNEGHSDVLTGTTQVSESPYKEDLIWKDGNILSTFSDRESYDASWGSGPQPSNNYYRRTIDRTTHEKEISYIVDLRYNLYSYYYANVHDKENIAGDAISYVEDIDEGNEIMSDLMPSKISLYSDTWPTYTSSTSPYRIERELYCDPFLPSSFNSRRYGLSNFGWFLRSPGSGMVDSGGNYAISHPSLADFGYETLAPTNLLTDGRLEDVIKNAPPNAYYSPISVLY